MTGFVILKKSAKPHKYIEKIPTGNPERPWEYIYEHPKGRRKKAEEQPEISSSLSLEMMNASENKEIKEDLKEKVREIIKNPKYEGIRGKVYRNYIEKSPTLNAVVHSFSDGDVAVYNKDKKGRELKLHNFEKLVDDTEKKYGGYSDNIAAAMIMEMTGFGKNHEMFDDFKEAFAKFKELIPEQKAKFEKDFSPLEINGKKIDGLYTSNETGDLYLVGLDTSEASTKDLHDPSLSSSEKAFRAIRHDSPFGSFKAVKLDLDSLESVKNKGLMHSSETASDVERRKELKESLDNMLHDVYQSVIETERDEWTEVDEELILGLSLYTDKGYSFVRDLDSWEPELASMEFEAVMVSNPEADPYLDEEDKEWVAHPGTLENFKKAREVITSLARMPYTHGEPLYRGMAIPKEAADSIAGQGEIDLSSISSWSTDSVVANNFMLDNYGEDDVGIILKMEQPKYGSYIAPLSAFPMEEEVITGGTANILSAEKKKLPGGSDCWYLTVEQTAPAKDPSLEKSGFQISLFKSLDEEADIEAESADFEGMGKETTEGADSEIFLHEEDLRASTDKDSVEASEESDFNEDFLAENPVFRRKLEDVEEEDVLSFRDPETGEQVELQVVDFEDAVDLSLKILEEDGAIANAFPEIAALVAASFEDAPDTMEFFETVADSFIALQDKVKKMKEDEKVSGYRHLVSGGKTIPGFMVNRKDKKLHLMGFVPSGVEKDTNKPFSQENVEDFLMSFLPVGNFKNIPVNRDMIEHLESSPGEFPDFNEIQFKGEVFS